MFRKPKYSNHELYSLMLRCWAEEPEKRPRFEVIRSALGLMLKDNIKATFAAMNEAFMQKYKTSLKPETDFLSKFASPNIESMQQTEQTNQPTKDNMSGYIDMHSKIEEGTNGYIQMQPMADSELRRSLIMEANEECLYPSKGLINKNASIHKG